MSTAKDRSPQQILQRLAEEIPAALSKLKKTDITAAGGTLKLYSAGLNMQGRGYESVFPRDTLYSIFLNHDMELLKNIITFCLARMGAKSDAHTGEEPGKIPHEVPGVQLRGRDTEYNASDTTALFLIGCHKLLAAERGEKLLRANTDKLKNAVEYIIKHFNSDFLFEESPRYAGADKFALRVTYWKDMHIPARPDGEPECPVVYPLLHITNLAGLKAALAIFDKLSIDYINLAEIKKLIDRGYESYLRLCWDEKLDFPYLYIDQHGAFGAISSDGLHSLLFMDTERVPMEKVDSIVSGSKTLATDYGYRTYAPGQLEFAPQSYHFGTIWPFEQAVIAAGAERFGKEQAVEVSSRVIAALPNFANSFPEVLSLDKAGKLQSKWCDIQLWTIAAVQYFLRKNIGT